MPRSIKIPAVLLAAVLMIASCAGSGDGDDAAGSPSIQREKSTTTAPGSDDDGTDDTGADDDLTGSPTGISGTRAGEILGLKNTSADTDSDLEQCLTDGADEKSVELGRDGAIANAQDRAAMLDVLYDCDFSGEIAAAFAEGFGDEAQDLSPSAISCMEDFFADRSASEPLMDGLLQLGDSGAEALPAAAIEPIVSLFTTCVGGAELGAIMVGGMGLAGGELSPGATECLGTAMADPAVGGELLGWGIANPDAEFEDAPTELARGLFQAVFGCLEGPDVGLLMGPEFAALDDADLACVADTFANADTDVIDSFMADDFDAAPIEAQEAIVGGIIECIGMGDFMATIVAEDGLELSQSAVECINALPVSLFTDTLSVDPEGEAFQVAFTGCLTVEDLANAGGF